MESIDILSTLIRQRRSTKPALFNGAKLPDAQVQQLLELADWAPTHAFSEPWRFIVYANGAVQTFCQQHAELYQQHTAPEKFLQTKMDSILSNGQHTSHLVVCIMKRSNDKLPLVEELAAASCAIQNILLGAAALDIAALWSTGGMILHPAMKAHFNLLEQDQILGILFLGKSDSVQQGKRTIPLQEKISWYK